MTHSTREAPKWCLSSEYYTSDLPKQRAEKSSDVLKDCEDLQGRTSLKQIRETTEQVTEQAAARRRSNVDDDWAVRAVVQFNPQAEQVQIERSQLEMKNVARGRRERVRPCQGDEHRLVQHLREAAVEHVELR